MNGSTTTRARFSRFKTGPGAISWGLLVCLFVGAGFSLPATAGWERQWIDSFDGSGVDWNNWTAQIQANFNNEVQCYTDDDNLASPNRNYEVSGGTLKIIARRQAVNCPGLGGAPKSWTSGRINSKDKREFLYGRIEARIRFDNLLGGTWPAFWMLENRINEDPIAGDNDFVGWPNPGAGEIDVWEWTANSPNYYITNFFNANGCGGLATYNYPGGAADVLQWHDYAIEWDANTIRFYIDDTLVATQNVAACPQYKEPMFVLLNVAMGGNLGGAINPALNQATMEVDYVAHCTATTSNAATRCNESTPAATPDLVIFEDVERPDWDAWNSVGGTVPGVVVDTDPLYAETMEFTINGSAVVGFTTRAPFATGGMPYDASGIATTGTLEFDLKMTNPPPAPTDWKLKVESDGVATVAEVSLTTSVEAHAAPVLGQWQHYSFNLSDLAAEGLDLGAIDIVLVFPDFGTGDGAVFRIDNVKILGNVGQSPPSSPPSGNTNTFSGGGGGGGGGSSVGSWLLVLLGTLGLARRYRISASIRRRSAQSAIR